MVSLEQAIVLLAITCVGAFVYVVYESILKKEGRPEKVAGALKKPAIIIDMQHELQSEVVKTNLRGDRIDVQLKSGHILPYDKDLFTIMNIDEVLIGEQPVIAYCSPEYNKLNIGELAKKLRYVEREHLKTKSRYTEERIRDMDNVKDVLKKNNDSSEDKK